jgi:hypothetical protein
MSSQPQILKISVKEPKSPDPDGVKYFFVKVIFKVEDKQDIQSCETYVDEYCKNIMYCVDNPENITKYYVDKVLGDKVEDLEKEIIKRGYTLNPYQILHKKKKKPGVYYYKEAVEDNEITRAAITFLKRIKNNPSSNNSRFVPISTILRTLNCLDIFWD